ncbi:hypothetical protein [Algoriphagus ratkowskyi]|nr:hypothetical protein [Algoriphagus ratkowskyi]TXD77279.1 hypothetical protein ESW18_13380 [Algoriphagus ratkowskyi]
MTITSRYNKVNAIVIPVLIIILLAAIGYFTAFLSFLDLNNGKVDSIFKTPIYGTVLLCVVIIGLAIHNIKTCKTIKINSKGIMLSTLFNKESIKWNDIDKIELFGKSQVNTSPIDTTNLILKSGKQIDIMASYYENMPIMRKTFEHVIDCLNTQAPIELNIKSDTLKADSIELVDKANMTKYSGNHFLSFNGIILYGLNAFTLYMIINSPNFFIALFIVSIIIFAFTYGYLGHQLHYFYLDKNHLLMKNHIWPWVNYNYRIDNIKQVICETPYKRSTSLRVITIDYNSKHYSGGSLKNSTWKVLLHDIQSLNIETKNEALY